MKKLISLLSLLFPLVVQASGLQSSFTSSNLGGLTRNSTMVEYDATVTPSNYLVDKSGRSHNLAPTSDPPSAASSLQRSDGTRYIARSFDGAADYYSVAHHADFNVFDTDFTLTAVVKSPSSAPGASIGIFSHYQSNTDGLLLYMGSTGIINATLYKAAASQTAASSTTYVDGAYHVIQVVRSNNWITTYVDGVPGTPVDGTGYGIDGTRVLYVGCGNGGAIFYTAPILYTRVDAEALSLDRLNYERNQIMGTGPRSGTSDISWDFSRAGTATQTYSEGYVGTRGTNMPRVGGSGGGLLIEGSRENKCLQSQTFQTTWNVTRATIPVGGIDSYAAPDGTMTADVLHEDNTAANNHNVWQTAAFTTGNTYTVSVFAKSINRTWVALKAEDVLAGPADPYVYCNVSACKVGTITGVGVTGKAEQYSNGWCRCSMSFACTRTEASSYIYIFASNGDAGISYDGLDQDSLAIWGAQSELGSHPSSYIPTTAAAVTRAADYASIRPYKIGKGMQLGGEKMWVDFSQDPNATNYALQSQTFGTTWTKRAGDAISSDSAVVLAPDGTATADGIIAEAVNESHYFTQNVTLTASAWTISAWAKPGNKNYLVLSNNNIANASASFDVANCTTVSLGAAATSYGTQRGNNGWCRCWFTHTATAALSQVVLYAADPGGAITFTGDAVTVNTWFWGAQVEPGSAPTGYIPTTTTTRTALVANQGWYALDKAGTVVRRNEYAKGESYHVFNGTDSKYTIASSDFNPAGNFSVVAVFTPATVTGNHVIMGKWNATTEQRGWLLYQSGDNIILARTTDGQAGTAIYDTKSACLTVDKPILITATYSTTGGLIVYVDDLSTATQAATGTVYAANANFMIGQNDSALGYLSGNLHYLAFYDHGVGGVVLTEAQHDALYAKFKQANILPRKIGTSYVDKKLYVEFDMKCPYTGNGDITDGTSPITIGGNIGSADFDTNDLLLYNSGTGFIMSVYPNGENTNRYMYITPFITKNLWHHYRFYWDFAALQNSYGYVDSTLWTNHASLTGAKDFDFSDTLIRLGQLYNGTVGGGCTTKNLRIWSAP